MSNRYNSQLEFSKHQKGLRWEVEEYEFKDNQEITNFVRSKMNKIWSDKDKLIKNALEKKNKLEQRLADAEKVIEFYDINYGDDYDKISDYLEKYKSTEVIKNDN